jgi:hypothetical protein
MRYLAVSLAVLACYCATSRFEPRYDAWTVPRWSAESRDTCQITVFALSSHETQIAWRSQTGVHFVLDTATSEDVVIRAGMRWSRTYVFIDSESGKILAKRKVRFSCYPSQGKIRPFVES